MDNNDEKENEVNKTNDSESESPDENIPLWLQGLEERENDATKPITSADKDSAWIREIDKPSSEEFTVDSTDESETDSDNASLNGEGREEDSSVDDSPNSQMIKSPPELETGDESEYETLDQDLLSQPNEPEIIESDSPKGFVDISEFGISESTDQEEVSLDDEPLREGELPEWLQEMIAETEEKESETVALQEPEMMDEQPSPEQDWTPIDDELIPEVQAAEDELPSALQEEQADVKPDLPIAEEDTTPVELPADEEEPIALTEEEPESEQPHPVENEILMDRAKEKLDQGSYREAYQIINDIADDSTGFEKLETWLSEHTDRDEKPNSELLEVMGDVAMSQGKPDQAFDSYAKAIKYLLMNDEAFDEVD